MQVISHAQQQDLNTFNFATLLSAHGNLSFNITNTAWSAGKAALSAGEESKIHTLILVGAGFNFSLLQSIVEALSLRTDNVEFTKNKYHCYLDKSVLNMQFSSNIDEDLQSKARMLSELFFIDVFIKPPINIADAGLVVFDMDSTLIEMECIDEIAKLAGVGEQVAEVTEKAMQGEIAFSESLYHRVNCLAGVELSALLNIRQRLPYMPGFAALISELKGQGWTLVIASGGFTYFANHIKAHFGFDAAYSNVLEVKDDRLTGKVLGSVVDAQAKADILQNSAEEHAIPLSKTIAVGDGANDLVMMERAGTGLAFRAKPQVQEKADNAVRFSGLEALLYLLG
ncbi:phosphoserine phosphatase SerB [Glaciecola sp. MH2013]|uniref:phosphoserine phosphatase SerB n=1 Tax=Glaciecola sp. MH2013 TaxID=2785524 RepID=UPI001E58256C|nr:phosphoserine phosphatase SerB [Glaciecola sp. MH2013]